MTPEEKQQKIVRNQRLCEALVKTASGLEHLCEFYEQKPPFDRIEYLTIGWNEDTAFELPENLNDKYLEQYLKTCHDNYVAALYEVHKRKSAELTQLLLPIDKSQKNVPLID